MSANENEKILALGGLLKRIGNFDSTTYESDFNSRLILQKTVYLMQEFGLNIGYSFSWYLHGPYSPNLTRDTYTMVKGFAEIEPVKFADLSAENRFCEFINFIRPISRNHVILEQLAVVHFLCNVYPRLSQQELFFKVKDKIPSITFDEFIKIKTLLRNNRLSGNE